jgi:hypothetical protein
MEHRTCLLFPSSNPATAWPSGKRGRVVHVHKTIDLRDDVVVVLFDDDADALAVPLTSIRRIPRGAKTMKPRSKQR